MAVPTDTSAPGYPANCMPVNLFMQTSNANGFSPNREEAPFQIIDQIVKNLITYTISNIIANGFSTAFYWLQKKIWGDPHVNALVEEQEILVALSASNCGNLPNTEATRRAALAALASLKNSPELYREHREYYHKCFEYKGREPSPSKE